MTEPLGGARPADIRPGTDPTVERRRASRELDQLLGVGRADRVTPNWDDFAMGWEERRARGIELLELAA